MTNVVAPDQDLYCGMIRLRILHDAARRPVFGQRIVDQLARHGLNLSSGPLYPLLHALERRGYLQSELQRDGKTVRRLYKSTPAGKSALRAAMKKVRRTFGHLLEEPRTGLPLLRRPSVR